MSDLFHYRRMALKMAEIVDLGDGEGYAAKIPGFSGLLAVGANKRQVMSELGTALDDWMSLALKRGLGLPALGPSKNLRSRRLVTV